VATTVISRDDARLYLARNASQYLVQLGALAYDPLRDMRAYMRAGSAAALALIVDQPAGLPDQRPAVMLAADDLDALAALLEAGSWPAAAIWVTSDISIREFLEGWLHSAPDPERGQVVFGGARPGRMARIPDLAAQVRELHESDAADLDLAPVRLSATALLGWKRRGWRVCGAVAGRALLCHVLAAYPVEWFDEVAAVFTAPGARGRGLGTAVVSAVLDDIERRGRAAFYVAARTNLASQGVAAAAGLGRGCETWEFSTGQEHLRRAPGQPFNSGG
jgi:ribosomal protein S18 acetylase RimI-like enzyme